MAKVLAKDDDASPHGAQATPPRPPPTIDLEQPILKLAQNITVRMMKHSDATGLAKYANNKKVAQNMRATWPENYSEDDAHEFITKCRNKKEWKSTMYGRPPSSSTSTSTFDTSKDDNDDNDDEKNSSTTRQGQKLPTAWTIWKDDEIIGSMGYQFHDDTEIRAVSVGYWIAEKFWGKGLGTIIMAGFVPWFFDMYPYIVRLEAMVYAWNPASGRVLEKSGFQHEGTLKAAVWRYGKLTDLLVYGIVRDGAHLTYTQPISEK